MHTNPYHPPHTAILHPPSRCPPRTSLLPSVFKVIAKAVGGTYLFLLMRLPAVYAARASRYAATSAQRVAFISLLIGEWKVVILTSTCQLSSVISPMSGLYSITDDHDRSILAIFEAYRAVDHIVVQTLGLVSLACAIMTISFSSILVATFAACRADIEAQDADHLRDITADVNGTVSSVSNSFRLSFAMLTSTVSSSFSTPVDPGVSGGTTMSLSLNPLCGWHGPSLHLSHQRKPYLMPIS